MAAQTRQELVDRYFGYIRDLRAGRKEAVDKLVDLWDEDGVFEFAGAPPVVGTFKGRNAIHTLYKNRVNANGMPITLSGEGRAAALRETALGMVDTRIHRARILDKNLAADAAPERVAVGWTTVIGTSDQRGFEVSGNHTFTFKGDRIASLKVVVSPKADKSDGLRLEGLAVEDIGRLSLAAWAVV
jgi:ketosteroid isomerase-like protein